MSHAPFTRLPFEALPERPTAPHPYLSLPARSVTIDDRALGAPVRVAYRKLGEGPPLLLVHGFPETKRIWARNVEPLVTPHLMKLALREPLTADAVRDALRNLERYVQNQTFSNPQGGVNDPGATIQFDTKGVEFGPWIRRFVARVRRNWFIPYAAMTMRGRVVLTFFVHRSGALTDVTVIQPSSIESFNTAAINALRASNPTTPLPPEYPDDKAFFTVTFYYNESPGH